MEATTGFFESTWNFAIRRLISSEARTSPPGESTLRITALTRSSSCARLSWALITSTMLYPPELIVRLVMMPPISRTAILFTALLSSVTISSNFGPTVRPDLVLPVARLRLKRLPRFISMLMASNNSRTMEKTIQPRPRRGGGVRGAIITGGGGGGGEDQGGGL